MRTSRSINDEHRYNSFKTTLLLSRVINPKCASLFLNRYPWLFHVEIFDTYGHFVGFGLEPLKRPGDMSASLPTGTLRDRSLITERRSLGATKQ